MECTRRARGKQTPHKTTKLEEQASKQQAFGTWPAVRLWSKKVLMTNENMMSVCRYMNTCTKTEASRQEGVGKA